MNSGKVFLSVLLAAATGVAVGMLFAPEKGSRTRRKIREKGEDYLEDLKEDYEHKVRSFKRKVDAAFEDISSKISKPEVATKDKA